MPLMSRWLPFSGHPSHNKNNSIKREKQTIENSGLLLIELFLCHLYASQKLTIFFHVNDTELSLGSFWCDKISSRDIKRVEKSAASSYWATVESWETSNTDQRLIKIEKAYAKSRNVAVSNVKELTTTFIKLALGECVLLLCSVEERNNTFRSSHLKGRNRDRFQLKWCRLLLSRHKNTE